MTNKLDYCRRILNTYHLIVDFDGEPHRNNVPGSVDGETYSAWKSRVLGDNVENVVVYAPYIPHGAKRLEKLQVEAGALHVKRMFKDVRKQLNVRLDEAIQEVWDEASRELEDVEEEKEEAIQRYTNYAQDVLEDLVCELELELEPPVVEFIKKNFLNEPIVDTDELVKKMLLAYNDCVRNCRASLQTE